jgi:hypothetical protein
MVLCNKSETIGFAGLVPIIFNIPNQKNTVNNANLENGILIFLNKLINQISNLNKSGLIFLINEYM